MKKLLIVAVAAIALSGCNQISAPTTMKLHNPDAAYEIDTWGTNSEIYEFTPQTAPNKTCVMFMLDSGNAMGLQCFNKESNNV